jgi:hypothetical protein
MLLEMAAANSPLLGKSPTAAAGQQMRGLSGHVTRSLNTTLSGQNRGM